MEQNVFKTGGCKGVGFFFVCVKCLKLCEFVYMISSHHLYQFDDLDPISETQGYQRYKIVSFVSLVTLRPIKFKLGMIVTYTDTDKISHKLISLSLTYTMFSDDVCLFVLPLMQACWILLFLFRIIYRDLGVLVIK